MARQAAKASRRKRLTEICESLPEAETTGDQHLNFRVRGRVFAYYLDDHHGDGLVVVAVKASPAVQSMLLEEDPGRFLPTPYMAHRGWISVRIDGRSVDWDEVENAGTQCLPPGRAEATREARAGAVARRFDAPKGPPVRSTHV